MVTPFEIMQNISHPVNSYFFSKNLRINHFSKAEILKKLSPFFGLVYLENNANPIIGFLPKKYLLVTGQTCSEFNRDLAFNYVPKVNAESYLDFIQFGSTSSSFKAEAFHGGYIGFVDYNFAAQQSIQSQTKQQPNFYIGQYDSFISFEHEEWIFNSHEEEAELIFENILAHLNHPTKEHEKFELNTLCQARWNEAEYHNAFEQIQNYIVAGDCYQINLTQEFHAKSKGLLLDTAEKFWKLTDAPYSAYLKIDQFELLSCSPELFIDFKQDREVITKPIKGTMPRDENPILDQQSKQTLIDSEKDRAENVMIVDLLRNDLSLYAETGSVKTTKLFDIESFNQVHHMVSEVRATLKSEANPFEVLMAALPGGSITGAPKIRAMQIIEELEGNARGAYCGSVGYFNYDGTGSWNILIRSLQKYQDELSLWAGGGITIASNADSEYQECFDKIAALIDLINTWHTPE